MNRLADRLVEAWKANAQCAFEPGLDPKDSDEAYVLQAATAERLATAAVGWKVGVAAHGEPFAAPIFARNLQGAGAILGIPAGDPVKVEVELAIRLGRDLPRRGHPYARRELLEATEAVCVGFELVRSRFFARSQPSFLARLADSYNNGGFVLGDETRSFEKIDLTRLRVRFWVDGALSQEAIASHQMGDPLAPVLAWAAAQRDRLGGLRAGQIVTTGTLTVPEPILRPARLEAEIEGIGRVCAEFRAA